MTESELSRRDIIASLNHYTSILAAKNKTLVELSHTSGSLRTALEHDLQESVDSLLRQRHNQCKHLAEICRQSPDGTALLDFARMVVENGEDDLNKAANLLLSENSRYETLASEVMTCQRECETIMKSRLETTSKALHQSIQRRKLDAAYGQASSHSKPAFLDRQR